jgi:hypothetical protein
VDISKDTGIYQEKFIPHTRWWNESYRRRAPPLLFIFPIEDSSGRSSRWGVAGVPWPPATLDEKGGG